MLENTSQPPSDVPSVTSGTIEDLFFARTEGFVNYTEIPSSGIINSVYKAQYRGQWYILKGLKPELRENPNYQMMLYKEFEMGKRLNHPYVVKTLWKRKDPVIGPCIVMEYIDGVTLGEYLKKRHKWYEVLRVLIHVLQGMRYIHMNCMIHRDLKPDNIIVSRYGFVVKIIDMGLADAENFVFYKKTIGTNPFMAPELCDSVEPADHRADIYSFGKIVQTATRRYPIITRRCLRKNPSKRLSCSLAIIFYLLLSHGLMMMFVLGGIIVLVSLLLHWLLHCWIV
ncbi:MAG: serine/threonine protein kinase [Bacteroidales bacterium]|nr:serine/threonine protein kinase [Bacteroidales bacterium]